MNPTPAHPSFHAYDLALAALRTVRAPLAAIRRAAPDLAGQLERAATSAVLNVAEGARRQGRDRVHHYRIAAGSAAEARACLDVAAALGYADGGAIGAAWRGYDRVVAVLFGLTRATRR